MLGLERKTQEAIEKENFPGMYYGKVPICQQINYQLLTDILKTDALISLYERKTGIHVPDKYKKGY